MNNCQAIIGILKSMKQTLLNATASADLDANLEKLKKLKSPEPADEEANIQAPPSIIF